MSSPLATFDKFEPDSTPLSWEQTKVISLKSAGQPSPNNKPSAILASAIGNIKYISDNRDHRLLDYLLLGVLSIVVHSSVVNHFKGASFEQEIVEPIKPPQKVQITLSRPQPKPIAPPPPPIVQPKPPTPKVVPLKPQKPKPVEKVVEQAPAPIPSPGPVVDSAPVAAPAPPPPVVEEKITAPTAGADYLHNPAPEYPDIAQERGWEGKVLLRVNVQADGKPSSVSVAKSSGHKELDDAAVKTVKQWSFVPAKRGETPVDGVVTVPITFNL